MPKKSEEPEVSSGSPSAADLAAFRRLVLGRGRELYRDLPWRRTHDALRDPRCPR